LEKGWNLLGIGSLETTSVATLLGDESHVISAWKWAANQSQWAFYAPGLSSDELFVYARSKGYKVLDTVSGSEGFWVNAKQAYDLTVPFKYALLASDHRGLLAKGWNLVSIGESLSPVVFNNYLTPYTGDLPPSIGVSENSTVYQDNLTSLWAWDASKMNWYFYAPSLDRSMVLNDYVKGKGHLSFSESNKKLGPGIGFWVNKP